MDHLAGLVDECRQGSLFLGGEGGKYVVGPLAWAKIMANTYTQPRVDLGAKQGFDAFEAVVASIGALRTQPYLTQR